MMIEVYDDNFVKQVTKIREGSIKIGETIELLEQKNEWQEEVNNSFSRFVLVGIEEDIGTRAADIYTDTRGVFDSTLIQFLNLQDNLYLTGADILLLGKINTQDLTEELRFLGNAPEQIYNCVDRLDQRVYEVAKIIFEAGKLPILIGGGQNNAYPLLKALKDTKNQTVNSMSIAAHTCLAPPKGRTARNSYSYALLDHILNHYYVFGIHESEIPHSVYEFILANYDNIGFTRFEAILKNDPYLFEALEEANEFVLGKPFGFDINLNSVSDLVLSPNFPDGFLLREIRQLIRKVVDFHQPSYMYLCEAMSGEENTNEEQMVGKSLALLIADFIKASTYDEEGDIDE